MRRVRSTSVSLSREKSRAARDSLEARLDLQIRAVGLPPPIRNYRWAAEHFGCADRPRSSATSRLLLQHHGCRDWELDRAWPDQGIAVEIQGRGLGHQGHGGFRRDLRKAMMLALVLPDWRLLHVGADEIKEGLVVRWLEQVLRR